MIIALRDFYDNCVHITKTQKPEVETQYVHLDWPVGTFVWAKLHGLCRWPGLVWPIEKVLTNC